MCACTETLLNTCASQYTACKRMACALNTNSLLRATVVIDLRGCIGLFSTIALRAHARTVMSKRMENSAMQWNPTSTSPMRFLCTHSYACSGVHDNERTQDMGEGLNVALVPADVARSGAIGRPPPPRGGKWRVASLGHAFGPSYFGWVQNALLNANATLSVVPLHLASMEPSPPKSSKCSAIAAVPSTGEGRRVQAGKEPEARILREVRREVEEIRG